MSSRVVGIGEVLWDLLPTGPQLGGAPANFAYHAHAIGADASVITRVGSDDHGREVIRRFRGMGLPAATVQVDDARPTGTATVRLSGEGLAHFTIEEEAAWDYMALTPEAVDAARCADAICFGTLAQRSPGSRDTIQRLVSETSPQALRVFDINLRSTFYTRDIIEQSLQLANVLKLNNDELPVLAEMFQLTGSRHFIEQLAQRFSLRVVAFTRGAGGSLLFREGQWSNCLSRPVRVEDTVGAGDSFTAAMVLGLLRNMDLADINDMANEVARYVCSQPGATPAFPEELARRFGTVSTR